VSPPDFIPTAERTGLIVALGRVGPARGVPAGGAAWHPGPRGERQRGRAPVAGAGFVEDVAAVLAETGLPPELLTIEVTETPCCTRPGTSATLHALRRLGVGLALDDFGTAASSLGLLLPAR
jgi:EAL domain-containing protein (putative c-di-GMP-specific phosphodiesterase class I)